MDYLTRFQAIATEIDNNPVLELVQFTVNPPVTEETILNVQRTLGYSFDESIYAFYRQTNGLTFQWRINPALSDDDFEAVRALSDDYRIEWPEDENEDIPFAKIDLLPFEDTMVKRDWTDQILAQKDAMFEFAGKVYSEEEFARKLRPLDLFSTYYSMAFVLDETPEPGLILLSDYYIEWNSSRITDFSSYMNLIIMTRGIVESRPKYYQEYRGDQNPRLVTGADYWVGERIPGLFR